MDEKNPETATMSIVFALIDTVMGILFVLFALGADTNANGKLFCMATASTLFMSAILLVMSHVHFRLRP